ncbi:sensor histidine kinase family protein [Ekhidna lutea]|uniref:hypothetical protein n=1 Tax=Ekhidna lutea TaxID=447679 RepID=UPI000B77FDDC|nr:hypothetical protein [Ekhidna lutea]
MKNLFLKTPLIYLGSRNEGTAKSINGFFQTLSVLLIPIIGIDLFSGKTLDAIIIFTLLISILLTYEVFRRGGLNLSVLILCILLTIAATLLCAIGYGIHDTAVLAYPIIIGLAVFVQEKAYLIINTTFVGLSIAGLTIGEKIGLINPDYPIAASTLSDFFITSIIIVFGGIISYHFATNFKDSLENHYRKLLERIGATRELNRIVVEKDMIIREIHKKVTDSIYRIYNLISFMAIANEDKVFILQNLKKRIFAVETAHEILLNATATEWLSLSQYLRLLLEKFGKTADGLHKVGNLSLTDTPIHIDDAIPLGMCTIEMLDRLEQKYPSEIQLKSSGNEIELIIKNLGKIQPANDSKSLSLLEVMQRQIKANIELKNQGKYTFQIFSFSKKTEK